MFASLIYLSSLLLSCLYCLVIRGGRVKYTPARCVATSIAEPLLAGIAVHHTCWIVDTTVAKNNEVSKQHLNYCSISSEYHISTWKKYNHAKLTPSWITKEANTILHVERFVDHMKSVLFFNFEFNSKLKFYRNIFSPYRKESDTLIKFLKVSHLSKKQKNRKLIS